MSRKDLLADAGMNLSLRQALYRAARDYRGGINALALQMGIAPDALQKSLSPEDPRTIRVEWIEEIIAFTRDPRLLDALMRPANATWYIAEPVRANKEAMEALGALIRREGDFIGSLAKGASDSIWERHEIEQLERTGFILIRKLLSIMAGARQAMEDDTHA